MKLKKSRSNSLPAAGLVLCAGAFALVPALADVIVGTGLPTATTLGQATATQIRVESHGTGHGLMVPYFTTQDGAITMLNIANSDPANGKLVKMRIRGAGNGDVLLSMTLLLPPDDMWAAALQPGDAGTSVLHAHPQDKTCTLPQIPGFRSEPLKTDRLAASYSAEERARQTREGTVEYITMADIPRAAVYGASRDASSDLMRAIMHVGGVPPCGDILNRLEENFISESTAAELGLAAPTSGLSGRWIIMNVPKSLTFTGNMHAVRAVDADGNDARANFVHFPQTDAPYPSLRTNGVTADPLLRTQAYPGKSVQGVPTAAATTTPAVRALHLDFPDFSTPYTVALGADAPLAQAAQFSYAMRVKTVSNEYLTEPSAQFRTDWVMSMPARRFSVAMDHTAALPRMLYSLVPATGDQYFHNANMLVSESDRNMACLGRSLHSAFMGDREGHFPSPIHLDPARPFDWGLCGVVSVVPVAPRNEAGNRPASVLSASLTVPAIGFGEFFSAKPEGWAGIDFASSSPLGIPVRASAFNSAFNPAAMPGVSGNYGMNSEHWYTR